MHTTTLSGPTSAPILKTYTKVKVKASTTFKAIDTNQKEFTRINPRYSADYPTANKGILSHASLDDLVSYINTFDSYKNKFNKIAILRGIYKGGITGDFCKKVGRFLPFDIDVKKDDNKALQNNEVARQQVFELMQKIGVLTFWSTSGNGIGGFLYVPQLDKHKFESTIEHKRIAEGIYKELENIIFHKLKLKVSLDDAQGSFRQIRNMAKQKNKVQANPTPYLFEYECTTEIVKDKNNVAQFIEPKAGFYGSQKYNYNKTTPITKVLNDLPEFSINDKGRVQYKYQSSQDAGFIKNSTTFVSFSGTLASHLKTQKKELTAFDLLLNFKHKGDKEALETELRLLGITETRPDKEAFKRAKNKYKNKVDTAPDRNAFIYSICSKLVTATTEEKNQFILSLDLPELDKNAFISYLKLGNDLIFDSQLTAKRYVSEVINELSKSIESNGKIIFKAETGTGKTSVIINEWRKRNKDKKVLLLCPLTIIVDQLRSEYAKEDIVFLTGWDNGETHKKARRSNFVVATYEQGVKHLGSGNFDYIFIDEVHQLLLANDYKEDVITQLNEKIAENKTAKLVGLTGTPSNVFRNLGFHICNIKTSSSKSVNIKVRYGNERPQTLIVNHIKSFGKKNKYIFRLNEIQTINDLKETLIKVFKYRREEILVLHSSKAIKSSNAFKSLYKNGVFLKNTKVVLTTALIDEGLSIYDKFEHSVFIENTFTPRAEPIKQFFARFRFNDKDLFDIDTTQNKYLYLKDTKGNDIDFSISDDYQQKYELLQDTEGDQEIKSTYYNFTDARLFYNPDKSVNKYYLGNQVMNTFYKVLSPSKFLKYLSANFYIKTTIDPLFEREKLGKGVHISGSKERNKKISDLIKNKFDSLLIFIQSTTLDKKLSKKIVEINPSQEADQLNSFDIDFCNKQAKKIEEIVNTYHKFLMLDPKTTPDILLKDGIKLKPKNEITNLLFTLRTEGTLKNPQSNKDKDFCKKMEKIKNDLQEKTSISSSDFSKILKKYRVKNFNSYNKKTLERLIEFWKIKLEYDPKTRVFKRN